MSYHDPVLLKESIELLAVQRDGIYVDATFGGGGHSRAILEQLGPKGRLLGFDQDEDARANQPDDPRFTFVAGNFRHLKRFLRLHGVQEIDGLLADLGVSSHQFDTAERGFSYRFEAELDMRMNRSGGQMASDILNTYDPGSLQKLFSEFGEVRNARTLAYRIVEVRTKKPFRTIGDLVTLADALAKGQRMRYLSQVFQALRMEVNEEVVVLDELMQGAMEVLKPDGRLVVIAYHSIEDRIVKNFLKTGNIKGEVQSDFYGHIYRPFDLVTKKAVVASEEEVARNPRARSAKMRAGTRKK
ncbi:MAG: 16S rRNA (cytosine(1402)-N(4))-methyltransferase RsmH [Saprospirales bacterium]|nr:16S rRNA (cytosine(1402)-N(4))-methyltransferase RsmH [Saprospirales bacterium]MBK8492364.1 16S rRNA (cytosine(1402)-N(4))-methyltransferase RsmH [Saprospirales bacterium]